MFDARAIEHVLQGVSPVLSTSVSLISHGAPGRGSSNQTLQASLAKAL